MSTANQEEFINRIKLALGKPFSEFRQKADLFSSEMSAETRAILERIKNRTTEDRKKLLETLNAAAEPINLKVIPASDIGSVAAAMTELQLVRLRPHGSGEELVSETDPEDRQLGGDEPAYVVDDLGQGLRIPRPI